MEALPPAKQPLQLEAASVEPSSDPEVPPHDERITYGLLRFFAKEALPYEGHVFSVTEKADDFELEAEIVQLVIETLGRMAVLEYTQDGDTVTVVHKKPNSVTPGLYHRFFPNAGPVNPADTQVRVDPYDYSI